jgi:circadian clock protein KaiB
VDDLKARVRGGLECHVIDVLEDPEAAEAHRVLATPTAIRVSPLPECRLVGDLSQVDRVAEILDLDLLDDTTSSRPGYDGSPSGRSNHEQS